MIWNNKQISPKHSLLFASGELQTSNKDVEKRGFNKIRTYSTLISELNPKKGILYKECDVNSLFNKSRMMIMGDSMQYYRKM